MNTDRDPTDSATQRALRLEERNFVERYRFEARAHGVQQVETAATSTRARVRQFAVASTTETTETLVGRADVE